VGVGEGPEDAKSGEGRLTGLHDQKWYSTVPLRTIKFRMGY
jgi:hypothetical protein